MSDIFDKVKFGFSKGVNSISENSKVFIEKNKLNLNLKETEDKKREAVQQLGLIAYSMQTDGKIDIEAFKDYCNMIDGYDKEIESLNSQINSLQYTSVNSSSQQTTAGQSIITDGIRCSCGYMNKATANFCMGCGKKLEKDVTQSNESLDEEIPFPEQQDNADEAEENEN